MKNLEEFLTESNAIEGVYDGVSYQQALFAWKYCISEPKLTAGVILKTHKILMLHQKLKPNEKGYFRTVPVYIGGREAPHYSSIKGSLKAWCMRTNLMNEFPCTDDERVGQDINLHHVEYERIHPFIDGNGRTGRIFLNWQRVKAGLPILVINSDERHKYYEWFKEL